MGSLVHQSVSQSVFYKSSAVFFFFVSCIYLSHSYHMCAVCVLSCGETQEVSAVHGVLSFG